MAVLTIIREKEAGVMKKVLVVLLFASLFFGVTAGKTEAALIGVDLGLPDILSDSTGTYSYNHTTGLFSSTAQALNITFDGISSIPITSGSYSVGFYVNNSGIFTGGIVGNDLVISGTFTYNSTTYNGVLVQGEVTNFGFADFSDLAIFDFTFNVTGGALAGFFGPTGGDIFLSEINNFTGEFDVDSSGEKAKHDTTPVPEPGTMMLLGSGLVGLAGWGRKKFRK